jgi:cytochrome c553
MNELPMTLTSVGWSPAAGRSSFARPLGTAVLALLLVLSTGCLAQDAARGRRLFTETGATLGKDVASCATCHADVGTLRKMIENRGGRTDDAKALARWLGDVMDGAHPPAANAMAQFREVLRPRDLEDIAAYLALAQKARGPGGAAVAANAPPGRFPFPACGRGPG